MQLPVEPEPVQQVLLLPVVAELEPVQQALPKPMLLPVALQAFPWPEQRQAGRSAVLEQGWMELAGLPALPLRALMPPPSPVSPGELPASAAYSASLP